jgi:hypothetical protein
MQDKLLNISASDLKPDGTLKNPTNGLPVSGSNMSKHIKDHTLGHSTYYRTPPLIPILYSTFRQLIPFFIYVLVPTVLTRPSLDILRDADFTSSSSLTHVSTRAACSPQVSFLQLGLRRERTLRPSPESRWSFYRSLENV